MGGPVYAVPLIFVATISTYIVTRRVGQAAKVLGIASAMVLSVHLLITGNLVWLVLLIFAATLSTLIVTRRVGRAARVLGITCAIVVGACLVFWGAFRLMIYTNGTKTPDVTSPDGKLTAFTRTFGFMDSAYSYLYVRRHTIKSNVVLDLGCHPKHSIKWSPDSQMVGAVDIRYSLQPSEVPRVHVVAYNVRNGHGCPGRDGVVLGARPDDSYSRLDWRWKGCHTISVYPYGEPESVICSFSVRDTPKGVVVRRL